MKRSWKIAIIVVALLFAIALVPGLIPDEEYTPGAWEWLELAQKPQAIPPLQNRYHALVGFHTSADMDMTREGARMVKAVNQAMASNQFDYDSAWYDQPLAPGTALSELDFETITPRPLDWLASNRLQLESLADENAVLLKRYRKLAQMRDYALTLQPDFRSPVPSYAGLVAIHRLNSLVIADEIIKGSDPSRMRDNIEYSRHALGQAATILEKMIYVAILRFDLTLYASLLEYPHVAAAHVPIKGLNATERTLREAYITEFASGSALLHSDLSGETGGWIDAVAVRLYLKPRKLENQAHRYTWLHLLALETKSISERRQSTVTEAYSWWERYTDPIGYVLFEITRPVFTYHDRLEHIDGLITLVNSAAEIYRGDLRGEDILSYLSGVDAGSHPGYEGARLEYDADRGEIYFKLPGIDVQTSVHPNDQSPSLVLRQAGPGSKL